ncbi:MAG: M28 family peptidase [Ignavibacteriaceae bacterium]|nr:M28 family peptidase [Ignavibacteriaceae bacterium]
MKKNFSVLLVLFACSFLSPQVKQHESAITAKEIIGHISYLASDAMKGRASGSKEIIVAANYIKDQFNLFGLKPLFKNSFFQEYSFISDVKASKNNSLSFKVKGKEIKLKYGKDFVATPFSGTSKSKAKLVFAGYGIAAPKLNYDDYKSLDVKGKIVIVMKNNPEYDNPHSEFDKFSSLRLKATLAKEKGALGIIFVNGHLPKDSSDDLIKFKYDRAGGVKNFSVVHAKRNFIDKIFEAENQNFAQHQKMMKDSNKTASFEFVKSSAQLTTEIKEVESKTLNVCGYLEGTDPKLKDEFLVIGAHYDHLGMGGDGSLYKGTDEQIHNGADDNASGTTGVLELAEKFASQKAQLKRSIIFVTFSGEELGLLGSNYFVNNPPVPVEKMVTMLNLDMIGRLNTENALTIYGTGTSSKWKDLLNEKNTASFKLAFNDEGFGPSDHSSFYGKAIPVLFFFTGVHSDYHRPADDADLINSTGEEKILNYVFDVANALAVQPEKPDYINVPRKEQSSGGWKVYVGTVPDYSSNSEGFKLSGVSPGSPAEKAGLKANDIMLKFGDKKIENIYDYVYALQDHVPGDVVEVQVKRNNELLTVKVTLGAK